MFLFRFVSLWRSLFPFIPYHKVRDPVASHGSWVFFYFLWLFKWTNRRSYEKLFKNFCSRLNFFAFSWSTPWGAKKPRLFFDNWIHIHQVHSCAGARASAEWRCAKTLLPIRVITESKVASVSEPFWNIRRLRIRQWNASGIMILLYGAGGGPGRGEIPMDLFRKQASDVFPFACGVSRTNSRMESNHAAIIN